MAPCYRAYSLALRLTGNGRTVMLPASADIRQWLPGDSLYDDAVFLPADLAAGEYDLSIGIIDAQAQRPAVKLAIAGRDGDGWYPMGRIKIVQ